VDVAKLEEWNAEQARVTREASELTQQFNDMCVGKPFGVVAMASMFFFVACHKAADFDLSQAIQGISMYWDSVENKRVLPS